jgi:uncharacterized protein
LIAGSAEGRVIPAPVLVEVAYFAAKIGPAVLPALLDDVRNGAFTIEDLQPADYDRTAQLLRQYGDLRVGFVDAAVLAVVERLREPKLATLDRRHFAVMRPQHTEALELLPV